jgi:hypothetical protein
MTFLYLYRFQDLFLLVRVKVWSQLQSRWMQVLEHLSCKTLHIKELWPTVAIRRNQRASWKLSSVVILCHSTRRLALAENYLLSLQQKVEEARERQFMLFLKSWKCDIILHAAYENHKCANWS